MTWYESVKIVHILGTVLLFGTGLGTAFFLLMAYRSPISMRYASPRGT